MKKTEIAQDQSWTRTSSNIPRLRKIPVNSSTQQIFIFPHLYCIHWWGFPHPTTCDIHSRENFPILGPCLRVLQLLDLGYPVLLLLLHCSDLQPVSFEVLWWHLGLPLLSGDWRKRGTLLPKPHPLQVALRLSQATKLPVSQNKA